MNTPQKRKLNHGGDVCERFQNRFNGTPNDIFRKVQKPTTLQPIKKWLCDYCKKLGHIRPFCYRRIDDQKKNIYRMIATKCAQV